MYRRTIKGKHFDVRHDFFPDARFEIVISTKNGKKTLPDWMVEKILKEHLKILEEEYEVCQIPEYDKWYQVFPSKIDRSVFTQPRHDIHEEALRQELFRTLEIHSMEEPFETMVPHNSINCVWNRRTAEAIEQLCGNWNGQLTFLWQKQLEWAQRICNGESWKKFCTQNNCRHYELIRNNPTTRYFDRVEDMYSVIWCGSDSVNNKPTHISWAENTYLSDEMTLKGHPRVYVLQNTLPSVTRTIKNRK